MSWVVASLLDSVSYRIAIPSVIVAYWLGWIVYARLFHPLAKFPGPFWASISRWWIVLDIARGNGDKTQRKLHAIYGPIVRIAPNEVTIADPEAIKTIYSISSAFHKTDFYHPFRATWARYPDLFTETDERQHAWRRRLINPLYTMSSILQQEERMDKCTDMLIEKLTERAEKREVIDLSSWVQWYAFDIVGELFFSRMFGFLAGAHDHGGYIKAVDLFMPFITVSGAMPSYIRPLFLMSAILIPPVFRALKAFQHIGDAADACIDERKCLHDNGGVGERDDMLEGFFSIMREKGEAKDFGFVEIKVEVFTGFGAGSDTTAAAITSILYHLMRTPSAYAKLTAEVDGAEKAGLLSPRIKYQEAINSLPYMIACCKEGMRLHPSIALSLPRYVPKGGCAIAGEWFPEGMRVGVNAAVVQRDKGIFGEDAEKFVPERWFREDAANMERYMFQFGGGARTCMGKNISFCEIYKVIPTLLRSFHMELETPGKEWETLNYFFNKPSKVYTVLRRREKSS